MTGIFFRIHRLCTFQKDVSYWLKEFYGHLLDRGYQSDRILPLFSKTTTTAFTFLSVSDEYHQSIRRGYQTTKIRSSST
jgi:hypothetical protein